jgi:hypothetical protein
MLNSDPCSWYLINTITTANFAKSNTSASPHVKLSQPNILVAYSLERRYPALHWGLCLGIHRTDLQRSRIICVALVLC